MDNSLMKLNFRHWDCLFFALFLMFWVLSVLMLFLVSSDSCYCTISVHSWGAAVFTPSESLCWEESLHKQLCLQLLQHQHLREGSKIIEFYILYPTTYPLFNIHFLGKRPPVQLENFSKNFIWISVEKIQKDLCWNLPNNNFRLLPVLCPSLLWFVASLGSSH